MLCTSPENIKMLRDRSHVSIKVKAGRLFIIDQTLLPAKEVWLDATDPYDLCTAIRNLSVRGAPLIGVAAALSLATFVSHRYATNTSRPLSVVDFFRVRDALVSTRPTAVNLHNAMKRMSDCMVVKSTDKAVAEDTILPQEEIEKLVETAEAIAEEDVELCRKIANHGANFIKSGDNIITHCNTGSLATAGVGTALGAIITAFKEQGKAIHV